MSKSSTATITTAMAVAVRKIGGLTLRSIGQISRTQRVLDNDADYVEPLDMLAELADDNRTLAARLREAHNVCDEHRDVATASLIEVWIDETERRAGHGPKRSGQSQQEHGAGSRSESEAASG